MGPKQFMRGETAAIMDFENLLSQLLTENKGRGEENIRGENIRDENVRGEKAEKMTEKGPEKGFTRGAEMGDLPCEAPIAMTYTPWQRKGSPRFSAGEALDRGTLWPGIELPWKNNFTVRSVSGGLSGEVQALAFALVELKLYLDTHPNDTEAFQLFQRYAKAFEEKKAAYVREYGPLDMVSAAGFDRWRWIDDPWPWEYSDRR